MSKSFIADDQLHQMSKKNEPTINSRFGGSSAYQSAVSHYQYNDRRVSSSGSASAQATNLFRYNTGSRASSSGRHNNHRSGSQQNGKGNMMSSSATSVWWFVSWWWYEIWGGGGVVFPPAMVEMCSLSNLLKHFLSGK